MDIRRLRTGDTLTTDWFNSLVDILNELRRLRISAVEPPLKFHANTLGIEPTNTDTAWLGVIVAAPSGKTEYTDARYWVQPVRVSNTDTDPTSPMRFQPLPPGPPAAEIRTATNLAEMSDATHNIPVGTPVLVFQTPDQATPTGTRYYFWRTPPAAGHIEARIVSSSAAGDNRWTYEFVQVVKTSAGYGGWSDVPGGLEGTAYNRNEDRNTGLPGSVLGNGVAVNSLTTASAEFTLRPIPDDTLVELRPLTLADGTVEYWMEIPNGIDGGCLNVS